MNLIARLHEGMKDGLHNWVVAGVFVVWVVACFALPLDKFKEAGTVLLGVFGIVATAHAGKTVAKTIKGNGDNGGNGSDGPP